MSGVFYKHGFARRRNFTENGVGKLKLHIAKIRFDAYRLVRQRIGQPVRRRKRTRHGTDGKKIVELVRQEDDAAVGLCRFGEFRIEIVEELAQAVVE